EEPQVREPEEEPVVPREEDVRAGAALHRQRSRSRQGPDRARRRSPGREGTLLEPRQAGARGELTAASGRAGGRRRRPGQFGPSAPPLMNREHGLVLLVGLLGGFLLGY